MEDNDQTLRIGHISLAGLHLKTMLDRVVSKTREEMNADVCSILLLDESKEVLTLEASQGLDTSAAGAVRLPRDTGVSWTVAREKKPLALPVARAHPDFYFVPVSGEDKFTSMLTVPILDGDECVGVLYIQHAREREYTEDEVNRLTLISADVAGAIRAAQELDRYENRAAHLYELNETARRINATNNVDEIVAHVVMCVERMVGARSVIMWLVDEEGRFRIHHLPETVGDPEKARPVCETIARHVRDTTELLNFPDIALETEYEGLGLIANTSSVCCPMVFESNVVGTILAADRVTGTPGVYMAFSGEEVQLLTDICQTAAQAIARAHTHRRLERTLEENRRNAQELSILFQLSMAMQRATTLDDLLRVILYCVTVGDGLGFNRAILFLINESTNIAQGMIGLGPDSPEHAGHIWGDLDARKPDDLVQWLVDRDPFEVDHSRFNSLARSLKLPVSGDGSAPSLEKAITGKVPVSVNGRPLEPGDEALASATGCDRFAIAPLLARDVTIGAILVDNMYNGAPITDSNIRLLTRFAAPAGWAIENIRLFEKVSTVSRELFNLEDQMARAERLSALGEMSAEIAHELKNPLMTIGGFARKLSRRTADEKEAMYASIIVSEVERLESLLTNALDLSKEMTITRISTDINDIVRDSVNFYSRLMSERGIETRMQLASAIEEALIDPSWIKQVVINLILNAIEAMSCARHTSGRTLTIATDFIDHEDPYVILKIADTGGGIPDEDFHKIFNPFFTTKPSGTGLGLSLCKKIIRLHHGSMEIDNKLGDGVTFTIYLPCATASAEEPG